MTRTGAIESMFMDAFDAPRSYTAEYLATFRAPHANPTAFQHPSGLHEALITTLLLQWQHYWVALQAGDYNGDGMSDLLWRDLGNTSMWFMNGTTIASNGALGNIATNWTVQSINAD